MSGQQTLLQLTQNVLSGLSSDEINSISDTVESMQVATIIKNKYYDILGRSGLTKHTQTYQLTASADPDLPTMMYMPSNIKNIQWLKYFNSNTSEGTDANDDYDHDLDTDIDTNPPWATTSVTSNSIATGAKTFVVASAGLDINAGDGVSVTSGANSMLGTVTTYVGTTLVIDVTTIVGSGTYTSWDIEEDPGVNAPPGYQYVTILPFQQFVDMINSFNPTESNVASFTFNDTSNSFNGEFTFYYKNDGQPKYCTVLSNYYVIFDSYDDTQDTTLQEDKTMAYGDVIPAFSMTDSFTPNLDPELFPLLLNEAKALAFFELKQMMHPKAEVEIKRQWTHLQKNKTVAGKPTPFNQLPNFGRRGGGTWS